MLTRYRAAPALPLVVRRRAKTRLGRLLFRFLRHPRWAWLLLRAAWHEGTSYQDRNTKRWSQGLNRRYLQKSRDFENSPEEVHRRLVDRVMLHLANHRKIEWRQFLLDHDACCGWYYEPTGPKRCTRCQRLIKEREMMADAGEIHLPSPFYSHNVATDYLWEKQMLFAHGPSDMITRDRTLLDPLSNEALQALLDAPVPTVVLPVRLPPPGAI